MNFSRYFTTKSWWGKILGGFFGYLIAGSTGALIGILVGNLFDRGMATIYNPPRWSSFQDYHSSTQAIFFKCTFAIMGHVAKSDGRISENEIHMAKQTMEEMRLSGAQKKVAQQYFNEGKATDFDVDKTVRALKQACGKNLDLLKLFMDIQFRCAQVDGLSANKINALNTIFRQMGFAPLNQQYHFHDYFNQHRSTRSSNHQRSSHTNNDRRLSIGQAYRLLEVAENATQPEVKKAYRRAISRNHPDKLIAQGLPAEMIKMANDKTQQITKAYEIICEAKGW